MEQLLKRYIIKWPLLFGSILFCYSITNAQLNPQPAFRNLSTADGLPSSEVYNIIKDRNGYLWFGTDNGLSRYDGYEFENFGPQEGLKNNVIFHSFEDSEGQLWFNSLGGDIYIYKDGEIRPYRFNYIIADYRKNYVAPGFFQVDRDGNLLMSLAGKGVLKISQFGEDELWGSDHGGPLIIEDGGMTVSAFCNNYNEPTNKKYTELRREYYVSAALFFNDGVQFEKNYELLDQLGYSNSEIIRFNKGEYLSMTNCHLVYYKDFNVEWVMGRECPVTFLTAVSNGEVFTSHTEGKGARRYKNIDAVKKEEYEVVLEDYSVSDVYLDEKGTYWFSTLEHGVFYTPNINVKVYDKVAGLKNQIILGLAVKNEKELYFSDLSGNISLLNFKENKIQVLPSSDQRNPLFCLLYDNQRETLWSGARPLRYYRDGTWRSISDSLFSKGPIEGVETMKFLQLSKDQKVIQGAYYRGFQLFDAEHGIFQMDSRSEGYTERTFVITEDQDGKQWLGNSKGLFYYENGGAVPADTTITAFNIRVEDIATNADNTLIIGTKGNGVLFWNGKYIQSFTEDEGLCSNMIEHICVDDNNKIWVGTLNGISVIDYVNSSQNPLIKSYSIAHGLPSAEVNFIQAAGDTIWLATPKGLVAFPINPDINCQNNFVILEQILVNGQVLQRQKNYDLAFDENNIQIDYISLNYELSGDIDYRFRLGKDLSWSYTKGRTANFIDLPPGSYKFEVQAKDELGFWTPSLNVAFQIRKPYYLQAWFLILFFGSLSIGIFLLFRLYIQRVRQKAAMENQINELKTSALQAQMNPHFVFNCLNAIQSFIANQQTDKATRYLARFALLVRNNLNASSKKIISLEEEIQTIHNYLSFEKMRFQKKFDYEIIVDSKLKVFEISIPPLLTLPYVENAVIHGLLKSPRPGILTIKYTKDQDWILAEFIDNGLGVFQTQKKKQKSDKSVHKSVGMSISRKRLRLFNGRKNEDDIRMEEMKDESGNVLGTHITLRIKIK